MNFGLKNKTVLVAGGNGLIGRAVCKAFLREGAHVVSGDIRYPKKLKPVNKNFSKVKLDITSHRDLSQVVHQVKKWRGGISVLVDCIYLKQKKERADVLSVSADLWADIVSDNLKASFLLGQVIGKEMIRNHTAGSMIFIGSIYGAVGPDFRLYKGTSMHNPSSYAVVKAGLGGLVRYLAVCFSKFKIRVNMISPGGVQNDQPRSFVKKYSERVPLARMAVPSEVADAAVFFASQASSYVDGQNLMVDGGFTIV